MNCDEVLDRLGELIDGELEVEVRRALEGHLETCAACQDEHASLRSLVDELTRPTPVSVPSGLWAAVEGRLNESHSAFEDAVDGKTAAGPSAFPDSRATSDDHAARSWRFRWRPLATAAAVLLAVGLGWGLFNLSPIAS